MNGDRVELVRNDNYWGDKAPWEKVTFRIIKNEPARVAALLSGDVDAIEQPPTADLARIKADPKFTVTSKISHRVIYFNFDHQSSARARSSPTRTASRSTKNPLHGRARAPRDLQGDQPAGDRRARDGRAGDARRASSCPRSCSATCPASRPRPTIPKARRSCSPRPAIRTASTSRSTARPAATSTTRRSCRRSRRCCRASASSSKVETAPMGPYSGRASKQEFSFHMVGWGASTGEASSPLRSLLATFNRDKGLGAVNWGRYSNVKVDYLIEQALQQVDDENRTHDAAAARPSSRWRTSASCRSTSSSRSGRRRRTSPTRRAPTSTRWRSSSGRSRAEAVTGSDGSRRARAARRGAARHRAASRGRRYALRPRRTTSRCSSTSSAAACRASSCCS